MSVTHHFSFVRNAAVALLATSLFTGCSEDSTVVNPNIDYTDSYKVEYIEGDMAPAQGKTLFQIKVSDRATGNAVTGESVALMPMMYMNDGKNHSTPVDGTCTESATAGTYDCTVFYVMADTMNGESLGHWELSVMIGGMMGESAMFKPSVGMAMGGTAMVKLKNSALTMTMMGVTSPRTFQVFKSKLMGTGDHTFEMFISTMETMMSFPAVYPTVELNAGTADATTISTMTVRVSTDPAFPATSATVTANSDANGYWTAMGITGLTDGQEGTLYVEVTINNELLNSSVDGVAGAGIDDFATFTVTPGMSM